MVVTSWDTLYSVGCEEEAADSAHAARGQSGSDSQTLVSSGRQVFLTSVKKGSFTSPGGRVCNLTPRPSELAVHFPASNTAVGQTGRPLPDGHSGGRDSPDLLVSANMSSDDSSSREASAAPATEDGQQPQAST